jgi:hypothetical protein
MRLTQIHELGLLLEDKKSLRTLYFNLSHQIQSLLEMI